jgi:hypothetical protein
MMRIEGSEVKITLGTGAVPIVVRVNGISRGDLRRITNEVPDRHLWFHRGVEADP